MAAQADREQGVRVYERIRVEGKRNRIILRDPEEIEFMGAPALAGIEVNTEGEEVAPSGVDERRHIIEMSLVLERVPMAMNNHYGMLEEAGREYHPECRCDPRRPLNPPADHDEACPVSTRSDA